MDAKVMERARAVLQRDGLVDPHPTIVDFARALVAAEEREKRLMEVLRECVKEGAALLEERPNSFRDAMKQASAAPARSRADA